MYSDNKSTVKISREQFDSLIREVQERYPVEVCGALFGLVTGEKIVVKKIAYMRNVLNSEISFQIDPEEFLAELVKSEGEGLSHIGFFHSHPGDEKPSEIDLKYMKLWPESIWLIISSQNFKLAAFRALDDKIWEIQVEIE